MGTSTNRKLRQFPFLLILTQSAIELRDRLNPPQTDQETLNNQIYGLYHRRWGLLGYQTGLDTQAS